MVMSMMKEKGISKSLPALLKSAFVVSAKIIGVILLGIAVGAFSTFVVFVGSCLL